MNRGRTGQIADALTVLRWVLSRTRPWTAAEMIEGVELHRRTVYRWIGALEANDVIEHVSGSGNGPHPMTWIVSPRFAVSLPPACGTATGGGFLRGAA